MMKNQKNSYRTSGKIREGEVTALKQGLRDPSRVNVFLNGKFAFSMSAEEVITRHLHVGQLLSESEVSSLTHVSDQEKVFGKIVNFISFRPRSVKEIKDRLYTYLGPDDEETKANVMAKLDKLGYLNDREFAKWFVESRQSHRPRSYRHLASELYAKGLDKSVIQEALQSGADERDALRQLIEKKQGMERDKLISYLARRGFSWELIKAEVDKKGSSE
jgi:regulatory protein